MLRYVLALIAMTVCVFPLWADKPALLDALLEKELQRIESQLDGVLGIAVLDIASGKTFFRHENEIFPQASTIKIAVLLEVCKQWQEGKLKLDERVNIEASHKVGGSGVLSCLTTPGLELTLRDLCALMVSLSDNTATNILIDKVGMERINARMTAMGLGNTKVRRQMMDLRAAQEGRENISTPREMMSLLADIHSGKAIDGSYREELLRLLSLYKESILLKQIPEDIVVASKPGELEGVRCDCGIVYLKERPFVLCVMTTYLQDGRQGEEAIAAVTRAVLAHFRRLARASEYGRIISPY